MIRIRTFLKGLLGGIKDMASDKAALFTTLGAMLIPSAMVWALEAPSTFPPFWIWTSALVVALLGLIFIIAGWSGIKNEEQRRNEAACREERRQQAEEQRRQDEHQEYLTTLKEIARRLGVKNIGLEHKIDRNKRKLRDSKEDTVDEW